MARARDLMSRFAALQTASPWRVEEASAGSAGGRWRLSLRHSDGSAHQATFALGPAPEGGSGVRRAGSWRVEWVPPASGAGAGAGAGAASSGTAALAGSVLPSAAAAATAALASSCSTAAQVPEALLRAGASLRAAGLTVARAAAAMRRGPVELSADGAVVSVSSVTSRAVVRVAVTAAALAELEGVAAMDAGRRGLRCGAGVEVSVPICRGRLTAAEAASRATLGLAAVAAGPGVLERVVAAVRRSLDA